MDIDTGNNGGTWGAVLRIQVMMDVTRPLKRVMKLRTAMGEEQLIRFQYERAAQLLLLVWSTWSPLKNCELQYEPGFVDPGQNTPYGSWLRAPPPHTNRRWNPTQTKPSQFSSINPSFSFINSGGDCLAVPPRIMSAIAWNCQGLRGPGTVRYLGELIREYHPSLVFLAETKRIYGASEVSQRTSTWHLLSKLASQSSRMWLCSGDYNEILDHGEKEGGSLRPAWQIQNFRNALQENDLHDLGHSGTPFTWCNNQMQPLTIRERLDRACGNSEWIQAFPKTSVHHLDCSCSDHKPLLIYPKNRVFRQFGELADRGVLNQAGLDLRSKSIIERCWKSERGNQPGTQQKITECQTQLTVWSKNHQGLDRRRIKLLEKKLYSLRNGIISSAVQLQINRVKNELEDLYSVEETYWKERSRTLWLTEGDRNTGYFHNKASHRKKVNEIRKLRTDSDEWVDNEQDLRRLILDHFTKTFQSRRPSTVDIERCTVHITPRIDRNMYDELSRPFTEEEVSLALSQMAPLKAPRPDGMPPLFYQKYWPIVKTDVTATTLHLLNNHALPDNYNATTIVLIPKCTKPDHLSQFRPISLCNVLYKIASKTIANRLKPILDIIISPNQTAFIPGRLITNNVIVAYELNHYLRTKTKGVKGYMALKLDISKVYDKIEWAFLERVLIRLGFPPRVVSLIMLCISTVSYSFMLNGGQFGSLIPQRGIRQGDPLSPNLFLLCTEALSSLLLAGERNGSMEGIAICRGAPKISHLLFADDTLVFSQATRQTMQCIGNTLDTYAKASGQEINYGKSTVVFSKNVPQDEQLELAAIIGLRPEIMHAKYLGLPGVVGRSQGAVFNNLRD
ncbi:UNVERIFIED_CONTAM: putative mitochondrial protein [Sesamum radiatum]|uniref:Mitochondrial protein n=1 Tax=Sesamum radiatum TaxID=300843 RepID=A0AAW2TG51_SESRA